MSNLLVHVHVCISVYMCLRVQASVCMYMYVSNRLFFLIIHGLFQGGERVAFSFSKS